MESPVIQPKFTSAESDTMQKQLYLKNCKGKGRGVFCNQPLLKDEIIESVPLIIIPASQKVWVSESKLADYFFNYNEEEDAVALALGFGSLYNHAEQSNAGYCIDISK